MHVTCRPSGLLSDPLPLARLAALALAAGLMAPLPLAAQTPPARAALVAQIDAWAERDMGDPAAALVQLQALRARAETDSGVPPAQLGKLYMLIASATFGTLDYAGTAPWMERAAALYAQAGNAPEQLAEVYNNQAVLLRRLHRLAEAEAAARKAVDLRLQLFGPANRDVSSSLHTLANALFSQGRIEEATALMRRSVAAQEAADAADAGRMALRLDGLAALLNESGRDAEAVAVARRAVEMARQLGEDHPLYPTTLNTLAANLLDTGQYRDALPVIRDTLRLRAQALGPQHPWTAATQLMLATALEQTGALEEAAEMTDHAIANMLARRDVIDTGALAGVYLAQARIGAARGDWAAYDRVMAAGLADVDATLEPGNPARAFLHVFHAAKLLDRGRAGEAVAQTEQWVPVLQAAYIPEHADRIFGELLLARLWQANGRPLAQVWPGADAAAAALAGKLADVGASDGALAAEAQRHAAAAAAYLATAIAAGDRERAFMAAQLLSISELSLTQSSAQEEAAGDAPQGALAAHAHLRDLARLETELARRQAVAEQGGAQPAGAEQDGTAGDAVAIGRQLAEARAARALADAALRRDWPNYVARYRPAPVPLAVMQAALAKGDLLVMPVEGLGPDGWSLLLDRDRGLGWHAFDPATVRGQVAALRRGVEDPAAAPFPQDAAAGLFRALFPAGVPRGGRVLLYGGHALSSLPLAMLLTQDHAGPLAQAPWLVRRASVQVLGNLGLHVRRPARSGGPLANVQVAGIGGADLPQPAAPAAAQLAALFRGGRPLAGSIAQLPPLPLAEKELRAIADALPGGQDRILIGPDAAEERLKQADLSRARVLAFATHGLASGEIRGLWEPALLVGTAPGSGEDGLLGASEIARLKLDADWVILSACNTAAGADAGAPAYSGLATAFAQAGARALMLSHWRVRDDAAPRLSVATVRGAARGLSRAEALRRAQLALMADRSVPDAAHPAVWAPFVIVEN